MAIKLPDPGNGIPEQKTGNDEWTNMKIVRDNFADQSNAASRLVGTSIGNVPVISSSGIADTGIGGTLHNKGLERSISNEDEVTVTISTQKTGVYRILSFPDGIISKSEKVFANSPLFLYRANDAYTTIQASHLGLGIRVMAFSMGNVSNPQIYNVYTDKNTTKEQETGYLVASSPVIKMQHDSFEKVHEAEQLEIEVKNIETGVYEITGTTGLREGDGWNLKPPKDVNGNVLCICEATESNGVITLKTYKKKFDFETVSIVADYEQPTDIPEGATVMLRFNDLPQEQLDEPIE